MIDELRFINVEIYTTRMNAWVSVNTVKDLKNLVAYLCDAARKDGNTLKLWKLDPFKYKGKTSYRVLIMEVKA